MGPHHILCGVVISFVPTLSAWHISRGADCILLTASVLIEPLFFRARVEVVQLQGVVLFWNTYFLQKIFRLLHSIYKHLSYLFSFFGPFFTFAFFI